MKKTLMLVINQGFSSRYLLRSNLFDILKNSGLRIVILSPAAKEESFTSEFSGENVFHELYEPKKYRDKNSKIFQFFTQARYLSFNSKYYNNCTNFWVRNYFNSTKNVSIIKKVFDLVLKSVIYILSRSRVCREIFIKIESLITKEVYHLIFNKYQPDAILTTSMGVLPYDRFIMQEAKKNGAKTVSLVLSWDNTTTKGIPGASLDYAVVWTKTMREEIINYHDLSPEKVFIGGVVQYDEYFKNTNLLTKNSLFKQLNLSKEKKTIFYCLESPTSYEHNPEVLQMLGEIIQSKTISTPCQLVVRPHPIYFRTDNGIKVYENDLIKLKEIKEKYPFIIFDYPDVLNNSISHDMPVSEIYKLGALLNFSDVVLSFYSSMNIEASIFNTPIINIEIFDRNNIPNNIVANHTHNKRILSTGGVKSVRSSDELVASLNEYLLDPSKDAIGRKKIVDQETGPNKGCSADKIGNHIVSLL
jgi:hypothetical protein